MAVTDTDLLLVQRGETPFKATADQLATYTNSKIEVGNDKDIPIASASQLGVIKVGTNLTIDSDGTLSAEIPAGTEYMGVWTDLDNPPTATANGQFWLWDADAGTLNSPLWGSINNETISPNDRLFYNGTSFDLLPAGGGGGLEAITGTAPIVVSDIADSKQDVSMPAATASSDGYMPKEAFSKLDGIDPGANANVPPSQEYATGTENGTLTLTPGGDTTTIPAATASTAGLMTAADKTNLDNILSNPDGLVSLVAGPGITVNTTAPGSSASPEVKAKFYTGPGVDVPADALVMPANISLLGTLPGD